MSIKVIHIHFNPSTYSFQVISSPIHLCVFHLPLLFIAYSFKRNSYFLFQHKEKSFGIIVSSIISFSPAFYSSANRSTFKVKGEKCEFCTACCDNNFYTKTCIIKYHFITLRVICSNSFVVPKNAKNLPKW